MVVEFGFAVRVKLRKELKGWLSVHGTACQMLKIGSPLDDLACRLPPPVIRWIMDERSVLLLLLALLVLVRAALHHTALFDGHPCCSAPLDQPLQGPQDALAGFTVRRPAGPTSH
jgi:hypothetical protein